PDDRNRQVVDEERRAQESDGLPGGGREAGAQHTQASCREADDAHQAASPTTLTRPSYQPIREPTAQQRADRAAQKRQPCQQFGPFVADAVNVFQILRLPGGVEVPTEADETRGGAHRPKRETGYQSSSDQVPVRSRE